MVKRAAVVVSRGNHQLAWGQAFASGLERHGWHVTIEPQYSAADLVAFWGVRNLAGIATQREIGAEICILERGYVADRFEWTSVSFGGGLNGRGRFYGPFHDPSRWNKHFAGLMKPWRINANGYALVLGQVPTDMSLRNVDGPAFWAKAQAELKAQGYEVRFRPHPLSFRPAQPPPMPSLEEHLAGAAFTVAWNSNSTVDAVLAGVPSVAMDEGSMAWDVTGRHIAPPPTPDREAWAHALAWKQWRMDELASGECWDHVGRLHVAA